MDRIAELLAKLADLNTEEVDELRGLINTEFERLGAEPNTAAKAEEASTLADAYEALNGEIGRRDEEQAEIDARIEAQLARLRPAVDDTVETEGDDPDADEDEAEKPAEEPKVDETPKAKEPEPVAASAAKRAAVQRPAIGRLARQANRPAAQEAAVGAAKHTVTDRNGNQLSSRKDVAVALAKTIEGTRNVRDGQFPAVSISTEFPKDRQLGQLGDSAADGNEARIQSAFAAGSSLVAAGGLCAPIPYVYDIEVIGTDARPIRDALSTFQADRGGVSIRQAIRFDDLAAGVGTWTLANDAAVGVGDPADDPVKPIVEAECPAFEDYFVEATTARIRFSNVTNRFDPEMADANVTALRQVHARIAENKLLTKLYAGATTLTSGRVLGATRDILAALDHSVAYFRNRHRLADNEVLWMTLPRWVRDLIRTDVLRGAQDNLDAFSLADSLIDQFFTNRNVRVTFHLDGRSTAQSSATNVPAIAAQQYASAPTTGAATVPSFPGQVEWTLCRPSDVLFLDGGQLDLGVVRDSGLNAQNRYELFFETFEGLAFRGVEILRVVSSVEPTGLRAGTTDTSALTD